MTAVVHIITSLARGGAQRVALEIAARLHSDERPQWLLAGMPDDGEGLLAEARARLGARFVVVPSLSNARRPLRDVAALDDIHARLLRIRSTSGPAPSGGSRRARLIVHTHSIKAGLLGRVAGRAVRGARVVHTLHGFAFDVLGGAHGPARVALLERLAAAFGDMQLFVSEADRETARRLHIGDAARSRVVRAGVDASRFAGAALDGDARARLRAEIGIDADTPVAVTVANLKPQKDPLFHVDVLAAWRALAPRARLLFLGDGPLRAEVEARARSRGVQDALHLPGARDPRPYLAAADVMLLASAWEGLPCSVLEGLVAGLPVVVRDTGWGRDLAFAGRMLARVDARAAPADVASALVRQCREPRGPLALPAEFTVDGMLAALASIYDELAS